MFSWRKKHNNKILTGLCGGKVCRFSRDPDICSMAKLLQQYFCPSLAHGYYGRIPLPLSATTIRKNDENIRNARENVCNSREKKEKGGPIITCLHIRVSCLFSMIP
jgi:hypothetical protein